MIRLLLSHFTQHFFEILLGHVVSITEKRSIVWFDWITQEEMFMHQYKSSDDYVTTKRLDREIFLVR